MRKILFVSKSMTVGGVEKSLVSLLNSLNSKDYEIDLLLFENKGDFLKLIPSWVNVMTLTEYNDIKQDVNEPPMKAIKNQVKTRRYCTSLFLLIAYIFTKLLHNYKYYYKAVFKKVKKINKEYDIAISYTSIINYISWFVCFHVKAKKKIGWIHFDIDKLNVDKKMLLYLHNKMDKIFVVSQEALNSFSKTFPQLEDKCELRYNIVDTRTILEMSEEKVNDIFVDKDEKIIMTLGRLTSEKGQDIIPDIALKLKEKGLKFKWYVVGEGNLKKQIINRKYQLGLDDTVVLLGEKINPYPYLKQADIYVQTSIHEGFCITLAEAKTFGMPIVSTKFAGAYEQLNNRHDCKIVNRNIEEMTLAIEKLLII